jgi:hypothetical protein
MVLGKADIRRAYLVEVDLSAPTRAVPAQMRVSFGVRRDLIDSSCPKNVVLFESGLPSRTLNSPARDTIHLRE